MIWLHNHIDWFQSNQEIIYCDRYGNLWETMRLEQIVDAATRSDVTQEREREREGGDGGRDTIWALVKVGL